MDVYILKFKKEGGGEEKTIHVEQSGPDRSLF